MSEQTIFNMERNNNSSKSPNCHAFLKHFLLFVAVRLKKKPETGEILKKTCRYSIIV